MKPIEFKYEKSDIFGHKYRITMPVPKSPELAWLCSNLTPDEHGYVSKSWNYDKQVFRQAGWHFEHCVKEIPVTSDEVLRVMSVVLSMFDHMQHAFDDELAWVYPEDGSEPHPAQPDEEKVKWMRTVYREMVETFADVLVGAEFFENYTLKEKQKEEVQQ